MSSEPPPDPITSSFNLSAWIQAVGSGLSLATASTYFLSKKVADTALGLITFSAGIKTNTIVAASGNDITIGQLAALKTVTLYSPQLGNLIADPTDSTPKVPSTGWVQLWFENLLTTTGLSWTQAQTFNGGVNTGSLVPLTSSGTLSIAPSSTAITIGTSQVGGNTLQLGSSSSAVSIPGGTTISSITTNTINATSTLTNLSLNATLNSQINIGTLSSRGTGIFIGSGASATGQVYINTGGSASGATNIMTGVNQSGNFNLGDAGNTVVININRPLTIGYAPSAITTTSQIGYTVADTIDFTGAYTSSTAGTFFTNYKTLPAGVWLIQFSSRVRSAGTSTLTRWYFWGENSVDGSAPINAYTSSSATTVIDNEGLSAAGTFTVTSNGSVGYNIFAYFVYSGSAVNIDKSAGFGSNVKRTRIA
jgi:hypothetical protein